VAIAVVHLLLLTLGSRVLDKDIYRICKLTFKASLHFGQSVSGFHKGPDYAPWSHLHAHQEISE